MQIIDLRTERQCTPIQIDSAHPRFSWRVDTKEQNWYQESYRIQVWKTCLGKKQCKVWDSGTVLSRAMSQIPYEGEPLKSDSCYSWTVEVKKEGGQAAVVSEEASFETAFYSDSEWNAEWITEPQNTYHLYRTEFKADEKIAKAKLYICGLGHEECVINGKLVTDAVMEAGWTDYNKSCLYCAYDVSELVTAGDNAICVKLGDGMYRVPGGHFELSTRMDAHRKSRQEMTGKSEKAQFCFAVFMAARITMAALIGKNAECQMRTAVTGQRQQSAKRRMQN